MFKYIQNCLNDYQIKIFVTGDFFIGPWLLKAFEDSEK